MKEDFFKFPSTPHLAVLGETVVRGDKVMSEQERYEFLQHELIVEEKVDGANLGVSFDSSGNLRAQNRGTYLHAPFSGQWKKLADWIAPKRDILFDALMDQFILFGEWCYAEHSILYDRLPDWFLGFDVFDKNSKKFLSCQRRNNLFRRLGIVGAPVLKRGRFSLADFKRLLTKSRFSEKSAEGLYLRFDEGNWLGGRAKLVRPEFIQMGETHWSRKGMKPNRLGWEPRAQSKLNPSAEARSKIMALDEYLPALLKKDGRSEQAISERMNKPPGEPNEIFDCKT